jgi:3',5'-cyclic-AMP phosphodiesterase
MTARLCFIHMSDTHISADATYNSKSAAHRPVVCARALVRALNALPFTPDFVLHTGDVAADPNEADYQLAREVLAGIPFPIHYLPGNHDSAEMLQRVMLQREPSLPYDYELSVNGVQLLCLDSNRYTEGDKPNGFVTDDQLKRVRAVTEANDARPLIVAIHHSVLPIGNTWWDDYMSMTNGVALHAALLPARHRLLGVLHGHVHQNVHSVVDGISYFSVASAWYQLATHPNQTRTVPDPAALPGYNVVIVEGNRMTVRQQVFTITASDELP